MKKSITIMFSILALFSVIFTSCFDPLGGEEMNTGTLEIVVNAPSASSRSMDGDRALDTAVDFLVVQLTHEDYPPLYGQAAWVDGTGASVSFSYVKQGMWDVEVFLNTAADETMYYGEGTVECIPGTQNTAAVTIYPTGQINIDIDEGPLLAPAEVIVLSVNETAQTVDVEMVSASGYLRWIVNGDPSGETPVISGSLDATTTINFSDTLYVLAHDLTETETADVTTYAYDMPYFDPKPGDPFGSGYITVTLNTNMDGYSIKYTTDGSDPTMDYGNTAGNGSTVQLTEDPATLKAISYKPWDPDTVSSVTVAEYDLDLYALMYLDINGAEYTSGGVFDFGVINPDDDSTAYLTIENLGEGLDLNISDISSTSGFFSINSTSADIPVGQEQTITLTYDPVSNSGSHSGTLAITSNDSVSPGFTLTLNGEANYPPTLSFLSGLEVSETGTTDVEGFYEKQSSQINSQDYYSHTDGGFYIFYETWGDGFGTINDYVIGTQTSVDVSIDNSTFIYRKYYGDGTNPVGESYSVETDNSVDAWIWAGYWGSNPSPYVSIVNEGVGGWSNRLNDTNFRTLTAYYEYADDESDGESGTEFVWYSSSSETAFGDPISGAPNTSTYTPDSGDINQWIYVRVTPVAGAGNSIGDDYWSGRVQVTNN